MNMEAVISDAVQSVGYDHETHVLRVTFRSGGTYDYFAVSVHLFEVMLLPHPWRRVGKQIRAHQYSRVAA